MKSSLRPTAAALCLAAAGLAAPAQAQNYPITGAQRATAQQVAQAGVPLSDLAAGAPDRYTVRRGDTLWDISRLYLLQPWRWPELWGMNLDSIRNPHLIFPGQVLVLERRDGRATLRLAQDGDDRPVGTARLSPRIRTEPLPDNALPTLQPHLIEPFLAEPLIVGEDTLARAPRIVATTEERVLIARGDRAYARGPADAPFVPAATGRTPDFRVFRNATPLRDPVTRAVLGYEAQYLGRASLVRGETTQQMADGKGGTQAVPVPASLDIVSTREEMRVGDRLLPEPPRALVSYVPHAPKQTVQGGAIVSMYGNAVGLAGQNQVVLINKGTADGIETGHVMAILKEGARMVDRSEAGLKEDIKLPDERNGLLMVFRPFERLSYALVLETLDGVKVGDRVVNPR